MLTDLSGAPADTLEQLQATYENDPGFLAAVFDGKKPIVIVEADMLEQWRTRLGPSGVDVAASCIDPRLLAAIRAIFPAVAPSAGVAMVGYNALDDVIEVHGIAPDVLLTALDDRDARIGRAARDGMANGTLRIDQEDMSSILLPA